jgi:ArsR family transcriptional regulator
MPIIATWRIKPPNNEFIFNHLPSDFQCGRLSGTIKTYCLAARLDKFPGRDYYFIQTIEYKYRVDYMNSYHSQARLFKVLMHPARLAILDLLRDSAECVCHMEAILGYRQAYISQQLMVLRQAGLVEDQRDGWNIYYRVINPEIYTVIEAARKLLGEPLAPQPSLGEDVVCLCPKCVAAAKETT